MGKKMLICCGLVMLMVAAVDPLAVFAEGNPLASPTPQPTQRVAVPVIRGVNPRVTLPEGDLGDITPSGGSYSRDKLGHQRPASPPFVALQPVRVKEIPEHPSGTIYNSDPQQREFQLSREAFSSFWERPSRAAVVFSENLLQPDPGSTMPWMGLVSAFSILGLVLAQKGNRDQSSLYRMFRSALATSQRNGIRGGDNRLRVAIAQPIPGVKPDRISASPGTSAIEIPIYETRQVQVGQRSVRQLVPVYETRTIQVGYQREEYQVPIYKMVKVFCGTRYVDKKVTVTRYRFQRVWVWKKVIKLVPIKVRIGKHVVTLWKPRTSWKRVQVTKLVPYKTTRIIKVRKPVYAYKRVQTGTRTTTRWVPRYEQKQILVGHKTVERLVPIYEQRRVQVGTRQVCIPATSALVGSPEAGDDEPLNADDCEGLLVRDHQPVEDPEAVLLKVREPERSLLDEVPVIDSWLYKTILFFLTMKGNIGQVAEKFGAPRLPGEPPHLFSLTIQKEAPVQGLTKEGLVINAFQPPNLLNLFYIQQEFKIAPKMVFTVHPEGLMDVNLTSKTLSMKVGEMTVFSALDGGFGFTLKVDPDRSKYDYLLSKHSFRFLGPNLVYHQSVEGVVIVVDKSNETSKVKEVNTLVCKTTTFRTWGVLVGVIGAVLLAALIYFCLSSGIPLPFPI